MRNRYSSIAERVNYSSMETSVIMKGGKSERTHTQLHTPPHIEATAWACMMDRSNLQSQVTMAGSHSHSQIWTHRTICISKCCLHPWGNDTLTPPRPSIQSQSSPTSSRWETVSVCTIWACRRWHSADWMLLQSILIIYAGSTWCEWCYTRWKRGRERRGDAALRGREQCERVITSYLDKKQQVS